MNRADADKAPEPSMEDILASIRRIISDDDRGMAEATAAIAGDRSFHAPNLHPHSEPRKFEAASPPSSNVAAEEDVLDLTDELVFAERPEAAAPVDGIPGAPASQEKTEPKEDRKGEEPAPQSGEVAASPPPMASKAYSHQEEGSNRGGGSKRDQAQSSDWRAPSQGSRPVWSRREFPKSDASSPAFHSRNLEASRESRPQVKPKEEKKTSSISRTSSKSWAEDIQMPVPDQGPVSLLGQGAIRKDESLSFPDSAKEQARMKADAANGNPSAPSKEEAVAALAQTLAKSAIVSLDDEELSHAQNVDFDRLDEERKSEVAQKFADAMNSNQLDNSPAALFLQPGVLDQMLRQDFARQSSPGLAGADEPPYPPEPAPEFYNQDYSSPAHRSSREKGHQKEMTPPQTTQPARRQIEPQPAGATIAQAQFKGSAPSSLPTTAGSTLEDAVREMLRPLLVQWLNEHMPRILEDAIREEISARGLPKLDKQG